MKTIVTMTMNPAIEKSSSVAHVVAERKLYCRPPRFEPGGGGVNVCRAIKNLGGESHAPLSRGGPDRRETSGTPGSGRPGPEFREQEWQEFLRELSVPERKPDYLVASGSLPPGVPTDFYARAARIGKDRGAKVIIDVSGETLAEALKEGVYLIKPNVREFRELIGEDIKEESQIKAEAQRMVKNGWCEVLVISLFQGPDKSHLFRPRKSRPVGAVMFQPPDPGVVIIRIRSLQLKNTCFTLLIHSYQAANLNIVWGSVRRKAVWIDTTEPATADSG